MMTDLKHSGVAHDDNPPGRGSGRYGYGTGANPGQHQYTFLSEVKRMRSNGMKDTEIAKVLLGEKATTTNLRAEISIQTKNERMANREKALKLLDEYNGNKSAAARAMGINESSLRSLLDPVLAERNDRYQNTADMLKKVVDEKGMIDISKGVELYLGVPKHTMDVAVDMLEKDGYLRSWVKIPQLGTNHETTINVLAKPGTSHADVQKNKTNIQPIQEFTPDTGKTWWTPEFPESISSKRIFIRYDEDGGSERDGVIELRKGVEDLSLEGSKYAQVRIAVDGKNYMKGMAVYGDVPEGYDVVYNTNKKRGTPDDKVFKQMKVNPETGEIDRDNPFGALIRSPKDRDGIVTAGGQHHYKDKDGNDRLSPINKLQDEGDWDSWSRTLSSQFLSKQSEKLINQQINISLDDKRSELDKIRKLTNPIIRKKELEDFAGICDSNASDLSVKGFKNQAFQVLLPIPTLKDNEIYAPNFKDGDTVALVRFPHGGVFEMPVLTVNNKHKDAKKVMGNATDAIGINKNVADVLSGADFDGDTAIVIPVASNNIQLKTRKPLEQLKGFDPKVVYKLPDNVEGIKSKTKQKEMGNVTNLITDMTVGGANFDEIAKAVRHSMVVIDSEKHHLDYKRSEKDHGITDLKVKYQGVTEKGRPKGASTILSKASSEARVPERKEITDTRKMTPQQLERWNAGKKVYIETGATMTKVITDTRKMTPEELKVHESGKKVYRKTNELKTMKVTKMDIVDDAMELVRDKGNAKEVAYANYANSLKSLADQARKEARNIKPTPVNVESKKTYAEEVKSLDEKLRVAQMNSPKERRAQMIANNIATAKIKANPDMDFEHRQREKARALTEARAMVGAKKELIEITDREWDAIQANAISANKLSQILVNTDQDKLKKRATPKPTTKLSNAQVRTMKAMAASGNYTQKEIADRLGISPSAVSSALRNG